MTELPENWEQYVAELVAAAPPLDPATRDRLATLLQPAPKTETKAA